MVSIGFSVGTSRRGSLGPHQKFDQLWEERAEFFVFFKTIFDKLFAGL